MSFGYDENNTGIKPIAAGEYEVYPTTYEVKLTQATRKPMTVMNYKIRNDVKQENQGSLLQYDNFVESEKAQWRFNALTKATNMYENGHDFGTMENWAEEMLGKPVRVKVRMRKDNKGNEYPEVSSFRQSKFPNMTEVPTVKSHKEMQQAAQNITQNMPTPPDPFANGSQPLDISDDDVPF